MLVLEVLSASQILSRIINTADTSVGYLQVGQSCPIFKADRNHTKQAAAVLCLYLLISESILQFFCFLFQNKGRSLIIKLD